MKLTVTQMSMVMSECAANGLYKGGYYGAVGNGLCMYEASIADTDPEVINAYIYGDSVEMFDDFAKGFKKGIVKSPEALLAWAEANGLVRR